MTNPEVFIEELTLYDAADAAELGRLMVHLTDRADGGPVDEGMLRRIIESSEHGLLVARLGESDRRIVGSAALSVVMGPMTGAEGYLQDFVTDPEVRRQGIGSALWEGMLEWCRARGTRSLMFTSNSSRQAAHDFYHRNGAQVRDTTPFWIEISGDNQ
jgi:GNAT superfamily N-acetyltransferase